MDILYSDVPFEVGVTDGRLPFVERRRPLSIDQVERRGRQPVPCPVRGDGEVGVEFDE
jgi:hypothetical protein